MSEAPPKPSLERQAARVRDMAAREQDPAAREEAETAAATLQFCANNQAVLRACAYFLVRAPWVGEFLTANPDIKIDAVKIPGVPNGK